MIPRQLAARRVIIRIWTKIIPINGEKFTKDSRLNVHIPIREATTFKE